MNEFRKELRIKRFWEILLFLAVMYGIGMLGSNLVASIQNMALGNDYAIRRGWSVFITAPIYYLSIAKLTKRDLKAAADILGVQVMFIYTFGRTACLFQGCCLGKFIPGTSHRWPLVIIELVFMTVFFSIQGKKAFERRFDGISYPIFLVVYGCFRMFLEIFRDTDFGQSLILIIGCVIFIIAGAVWLLGYYKKWFPAMKA